MNTADHARASELFLAARRLPAEARGEYLDRACGADAALRAEVESLLRFDQPTPPFLNAGRIDGSSNRRAAESAASDSRVGRAAHDDEGAEPPEFIGDYRILERLGEGGMGRVYLAEQSNPRRRVALKVIRSTGISSRAVRRFEHEAEALARLSHPCIAQLYDARLPGGDRAPPFIAMEYVAGLPLPVDVREHRRPIRERLELMSRVCDAVEHAHQRGVIHRDLKPGNILVTPAGEPKVLDFGIARLADEGESQRTLLTQTGELVGTLPYMSPEQIEGKSDGLDTRSDVYALGLILYELLADRPAHNLASRSLSDAARIVREVDPPPLGSIDPRCRGDVETIVAKAIEKDRTRRYQSVGEMAADLRRYLADRPIHARPASHLYQFRKFVRRNRAIVTGLCLAFAAMTAGTILSTWQAVRAAREARRAEATSDFLRGIFAAIDPYRVGPEVPVADVVRRAAATIEASTRGEPLLEARWRNELGSIYYSLGLLNDAEGQWMAAHRIRRERLGDDDPETLDAANNLGLLRIKQTRYADAESMLNQTLAARKRELGDAHPDTLLTMNNLAMALHPQGRYDEAAALCEAALEGQRRAIGEAHADTLSTMVNLASADQARGRLDSAERAFVHAIAGLRKAVGERHPSTLFAEANLARLLKDQRRYADAEPLQRETVEGMRSVLGPEHPDTLIAMVNLAQIQRQRGKYAEADGLYRTALEPLRRVFGEDHAHVATVTTQWALVLERLGQHDEARSLLTATRESYERLYGADHPRTRQVAEHLERVRRSASTRRAN
ncbi:MAG: serine/threonine-protein kinase [Phycisphaerae bacterium]|nr:serine/threonine-protein kinase [Phycisphaerae bacterium]